MNAGEIEDNSVVLRHSTDITNSMRHIVNVRAAETQKIEILGRSVEPSFPRQEEHRSFEDETVLMAGTGEAIQEALDNPSAEQNWKSSPRLRASVRSFARCDPATFRTLFSVIPRTPGMAA